MSCQSMGGVQGRSLDKQRHRTRRQWTAWTCGKQPKSPALPAACNSATEWPVGTSSAPPRGLSNSGSCNRRGEL